MDVSHARDSNMSEIESIRTRLHDSYLQLIKAMKDKRRVIALSCRQSGKCVYNQTLITIRNKKTNKIEEITIGEFFERMKH